MLRNVSRKFKLGDLLAGTACRFDLFARAGGELRRLDGQFLGELAVAEDLDAVGRLSLDESRLAEGAFIDGHAVVETLEVRDVHDGVLFLEDVGEAALRQTAMQRHLAAFEAGHAREAGAGLLPLLAAARGLAVSGSRTAADALLRVTRAFFRFEFAQFHWFTPPLRRGAESSRSCRE